MVCWASASKSPQPVLEPEARQGELRVNSRCITSSPLSLPRRQDIFTLINLEVVEAKKSEQLCSCSPAHPVDPNFAWRIQTGKKHALHGTLESLTVGAAVMQDFQAKHFRNNLL